ncbi:uncharacterized protein BYT42DRAFT_580002 [Radiomyces spectabilis]|uniref:uncharacterized protein n=1 Tax=Radiomyces spectabilis TaxID=64574 RepID=UPI002220D312|nr:uncharacterized protein BYT42DRAFT_580002 [Radiomyces spectabilis]KAI8371370.1 hypothetical protein BYT42DRAFT_580002 [Radiomyces spectabilis]
MIAQHETSGDRSRDGDDMTPSQFLEQCTELNLDNNNPFDPSAFSIMDASANTEDQLRQRHDSSVGMFVTPSSSTSSASTLPEMWEMRHGDHVAPDNRAFAMSKHSYASPYPPPGQVPLMYHRPSDPVAANDSYRFMSMNNSATDGSYYENGSEFVPHHRGSLPDIHQGYSPPQHPMPPPRYRRHTESSLQMPNVSRRRQSRETEDEEEKRKTFLERNRQAALKCRQRKKQWLANLQVKVEFLTTDNENLQRQATMLREEILNLKTLLLAHKECPVAQANGVVGLESLRAPPGMMFHRPHTIPNSAPTPLPAASAKDRVPAE